MSEEREPAQRFALIFGSNLIVKTKGTPTLVSVLGKPLFDFTIGRDGQILITVEIRDKDGALVAKVINNSLKVFITDYEDYGTRTSFGVRKKQGESVFEVAILSRDTLRVTGTFWVEGIRIIAKENELELPRGNKLIRNQIITDREAVNISECGFSVG